MIQFTNSDEEWKTKDDRYLKELQKMLDIVDNVEDEELRTKIILQYIKCDATITELAKKLIK